MRRVNKKRRKSKMAHASSPGRPVLLCWRRQRRPINAVIGESESLEARGRSILKVLSFAAQRAEVVHGPAPHSIVPDPAHAPDRALLNVFLHRRRSVVEEEEAVATAAVAGKVAIVRRVMNVTAATVARIVRSVTAAVIVVTTATTMAT